MAVELGGQAHTAVGLAGVGDLEVTGLSGRNKVYGARIGGGEDAKVALQAMVAAGQTVEGVAAARFASELAAQRSVADLLLHCSSRSSRYSTAATIRPGASLTPFCPLDRLTSASGGRDPASPQ